MIEGPLLNHTIASARPEPNPTTPSPNEDVGVQFERMFWAEMLSQAGFEEAFTQNGGEAAASFSRFLVESIAGDLALHHPLGLAAKVNTSMEGQ